MAKSAEKNQVRILYLEDSPADRELVEELMRSEGLASEFIMVETRAEFQHALDDEKFDLILSDYSLPSFDGLSALKMSRDRFPEIPFILLSGVMGEERAIESLKGGATDYVLKQRIERLVPSVRRAVHEMLERRRRREAEQRLQASEEQLRQITDNVSDLIVQLDKGGGRQYTSPSYLRLLDESVVEPGSDFFAEVHPDDRMEARAVFDETVRTGVGCRCEFRLKLGQGETHHLEAQFNVVCNGNGSVTSIILLARDITERRHSEEQLHAQAALLDKARDAITVCDMNDEIVYWNKGAEVIYGWKASEAAGRNIHELLHGKDQAVTEDPRQVVRINGEWQGNLRQQTRDGKSLVVQSRWTLVRDQDGKPKSQLIINTDITDRKLHEEQFLRSQRLESLGALTSGIAHDLNNMLAPIVMASQLLRLRVEDSEGQHWLDTLDSTTQRGANLVKQVLTFARGEDGQQAELSFRHLIDEVASILKQTLDRAITIETAATDDLWPIMGEPTQLHQVLMNLCVNARDAMPDGGTLSIAAENILVSDQDPVLRQGGRPGMHVQVTVTDTGCGMPAQVMEKVFDPFFTTKERGKGSGLGLTTVFSILKSHGGFISVESEVGRGTTFRLFVPSVTAAPFSKPVTRQRPALARGNNEWILLVDDEASFREIAQATLEKYGYRVKTASDGTEALTVFMRHRSEIALVITDIMMPVMDGAALIRSLQKIDADIGFIAVSGLLQSEKTIVMETAPDARVEFLPKPFATERLLQLVEEVLNRRRR